MPTPNAHAPLADPSASHRAPSAGVLRVEVYTAPGHADPTADALVRDAHALGVLLTSVRTTHVYLIEPSATAPIGRAELDRLRTRLLADPISERSSVGARPVEPGALLVEVHPLPGVMDPVAESVQSSIQEVLGLATPPSVATGWRYDLIGPGLDASGVRTLAEKLLANPVIQKVHAQPFHPEHFPTPRPHDGGTRFVRLADLDDAALERLSRDEHLFLSLAEMHAIRDHFASLGRHPRQIELETLAQTWSEHCVHKTLKSTVIYRGPTGESVINFAGRPGHEVQPDGSVKIKNLLKSTVAAATHRLIADGLDWTLSVFTDNSGVIAFDEHTAVCIKVETHNRPSAIEPYGGAATGVGGCIRDVIGTGLGARPIASTDVFCVAPVDLPPANLPEGCLHPKRILTQVVAGVRDYGNRMGIPTISGAVYVDERHVGNPLVFCGCVGVMPRSCVKGEVRTGDLIVALGGRTGRDGIHGATFSSAEIGHGASDEFAHAVQIGNAITEKRVLDAILRARDEADGPLYSAMTDCGAGGFSSAVGEMGKATGATVHLDRAPLKYPGLSPAEIWISEAQERMVLSVPRANLAALEQICREESVELAVLGEFAPPPGSAPSDPDLLLLHHGQEVGRLSMHLLHEGIPMPTREAVWNPEPTRTRVAKSSPSVARGAGSISASLPLDQILLALLAHPNIASKHWIIRQYDHEVHGSTAIKPLVGPLSRGPSDASVIMPVAGSHKGLGLSCGLQTALGDPELGGDPYQMVLSAIDECVRNLVCVGVDPQRIAILDNFCWPSCKKPGNMGLLVRAAEGCYDGALAYRTPFVSGKDSLHNEFVTRDGRSIAIPPTLLITGMGILHDVRRGVTMDAKAPGNALIAVGAPQGSLRASHFHLLAQADGGELPPHLDRFPTLDLTLGPRTARQVASVIAKGHIASAHDVSDGGLLCAVAEMLIGGSSPARPLGASVDLAAVHADQLAAAFDESPARYVLEVAPAHERAVLEALPGARVIGRVTTTGSLAFARREVPVEALAKAWLSPLDF